MRTDPQDHGGELQSSPALGAQGQSTATAPATFLNRTARPVSGQRLVAAALVAASCLLTSVYFVGWGSWPAVTLAYLMLAGTVAYRRLPQIWQRQGWLPSAILAAFWLASTGGLRDHLGSGPIAVVAMVLAGAQMTLVVRLLYEELRSWQPRARVGGRRWIVVYAGVPLLYWGTYLLAYFPGRMTYDSLWQWGMAHHVNQYNDWHPVLHTWLIEATTAVRDTPYSFVLLQLAVAASVVAYALWSLQSFGAPRWLTVALALVYAAYPASAFFSVTMWKDFPFAYLVLLTTTMFAWLVWTTGEWLRRPAALVAFSFCCFLTMHFRNNGLPVVLLALLLAVALLPSVRLRLGLVTGGLVVAHLVWAGLVLPQFHVLKPPVTQALAIPTQQIGATYASGGTFAPEVGAYFNRILPPARWRSDYQPDSVNPIKHDRLYRDEVISESFPTYLGNWAKLLGNNPSTFVGAFLDQTASLWQYTPESPEAHVYVGSNTKLQFQDFPVGSGIRPSEVRTNPAAVERLYQRYNPNGCGPSDSSCRRADRSDCFGERACVSAAAFTTRLEVAGRPLVTATRSQPLKTVYDALYRHLNSDWQGPLARGAIPLFLLLFALALAVRRERLRALVFVAPLLVALSVAAGMPATDLRYSYGWIVSVPFLMVLSLLRSPDADRLGSPDADGSTTGG